MAMAWHYTLADDDNDDGDNACFVGFSCVKLTSDS